MIFLVKLPKLVRLDFEIILLINTYAGYFQTFYQNFRHMFFGLKLKYSNKQRVISLQYPSVRDV